MNLSEQYPDEMLPVKAIALSQGQTMIVDPEDAWMADFSWYAMWEPIAKTYYARASRDYPEEDIRVRDYAHVVIMGQVGVDHINHDGLCNLRSNLRLATQSQNVANQRIRTVNTSGFKGVTWDKRTSQWRAQIKVNGRTITLGRFADVRNAARVYDHAAIKYFGEFARTNAMMGFVSHEVCDDACPCK